MPRKPSVVPFTVTSVVNVPGNGRVVPARVGDCRQGRVAVVVGVTARGIKRHRRTTYHAGEVLVEATRANRAGGRPGGTGEAVLGDRARPRGGICHVERIGPTSSVEGRQEEPVGRAAAGRRPGQSGDVQRASVALLGQSAESADAERRTVGGSRRCVEDAADDLELPQDRRLRVERDEARAGAAERGVEEASGATGNPQVLAVRRRRGPNVVAVEGIERRRRVDVAVRIDATNDSCVGRARRVGHAIGAGRRPERRVVARQHDVVPVARQRDGAFDVVGASATAAARGERVLRATRGGRHRNRADESRSGRYSVGRVGVEEHRGRHVRERAAVAVGADAVDDDILGRPGAGIRRTPARVAEGRVAARVGAGVGAAAAAAAAGVVAGKAAAPQGPGKDRLALRHQVLAAGDPGLCLREATRDLNHLARYNFKSSEEAWATRVHFGQGGAGRMSAMLPLYVDQQRAIKMFADWTDRIAAGELPPTPPRPMGAERNLVVTMWDWGKSSGHPHDEVSTDKRHPTVNAGGPIYAADFNDDTLLWVDPNKNTAGAIPVPLAADKSTMPPTWPKRIDVPSPFYGNQIVWNGVAGPHNPMMDKRESLAYVNDSRA